MLSSCSLRTGSTLLPWGRKNHTEENAGNWGAKFIGCYTCRNFLHLEFFSIYLFKFIYLVESVEVLWSWFDWKINCTSCCWCQESKKSCTSLRFSCSFFIYSLFCISSDSSLLLSNTGKLFWPSRLLLLLFWWEVSTSQDSSI